MSEANGFGDIINNLLELTSARFNIEKHALEQMLVEEDDDDFPLKIAEANQATKQEKIVLGWRKQFLAHNQINFKLVNKNDAWY